MSDTHYYDDILDRDVSNYRSCNFDWDCENCSETLCISLIGIAELPTKYGKFKILGFANNKDEKDHIAVVKGEVSGQENVLTRLHSSCLTGDAIGSLRCDCGPQLHTALAMLEEAGCGVLLYMQQEGRGIGLANKIRAYQLQDSGVDTYDANLHLGFEPDGRDYEISAAMLERLGVKSVRLLTNNPDKVEQLQSHGTVITERVRLELPGNEHVDAYMRTKKERFGHELELE